MSSLHSTHLYNLYIYLHTRAVVCYNEVGCSPVTDSRDIARHESRISSLRISQASNSKVNPKHPPTANNGDRDTTNDDVAFPSLDVLVVDERASRRKIHGSISRGARKRREECLVERVPVFLSFSLPPYSISFSDSSRATANGSTE